MNSRIVSSVFWVRTPTGLTMKNSISPDEFMFVDKIDYEYEDGSKGTMQINNREMTKT